MNMVASPEVATAFEAWKLAEMASHYAAPCPDAVMDRLVSMQSDAFETLQALTPHNAEDMLLKLFPVLNRELEPGLGEPPLGLGESRSYDYDPTFYAQLRKHLGSVSPALAVAMAEPHPSQERTA